MPSSRRARAEHSMCQPGRPGPHCEGHDGSSGADGCHSTKSRGSRLSGSSGLPPRSAASLSISSRLRWLTWPNAVERGHVEVHRPAGGVGVAPVEHHADEPEDVVDGRRGPGLAEGGQHPQGLHVGVEPGHLPGGQVEVGLAQLPGLAQQVVVDVGDVAHAQGAVPLVPQPALDHVVEQVGGGVADVGGVVGRDAARVHGDDGAGREVEHLPASGVVEPHPRRLRRRCR